jgi:hypothetical protein
MAVHSFYIARRIFRITTTQWPIATALRGPISWICRRRRGAKLPVSRGEPPGAALLDDKATELGQLYVRRCVV